LERVKAEGCNAVLVGEYFIKQNDIGQAVRDLKERCSNES